MEIQFVWREDKANSEGIAPIYLHTRAAVDGRLRKPTGIRSTEKFSSRVNVLLNNIRAKLEDLEYNYNLKEKKIYKKDIEACLPPKKKKGVQEVSRPDSSQSIFFCHWDRWVNDCESKISEITGKVLAPSTISRYRTVKKVLEDFESCTKTILTSGNLDKNFYVSFRKFIIADKGRAVNTFSDYIKNIKVFCEYLQEKDDDLNNDFRKFKTYYSYEDAKPLYKSELLLLYNCCHLEKHLEKARLILATLCSTAMRISDYNTFVEDDIYDEMITLLKT